MGRPTTCAAETHRLEASLASTLLPDEFPVHAGVELPSRGGILVAAPGAIIDIDARGHAWVGDDDLESPASLRRDIELMHHSYSILHPGGPDQHLVFVIADRRARVGDVQRWLEAVSPNDRVAFAVADPTTVTPLPPCPSSLGTHCAAIAAAHDERSAAKAIPIDWTPAAGWCGPVRALLGGVDHADPASKVAVMRTRLPSALRRCQCTLGVDVSALEYLTLATSGAGRPHMRSVSGDGIRDASPADTLEDWLASRP